MAGGSQKEMTFYNTISLQDPELKKARVKAKSQEDEIYKLMIQTTGGWTAWQIKDWFPELEITSIRRALWNLENIDKKIEQIDFIPGPKGKPVGRFKAMKQTKLF